MGVVYVQYQQDVKTLWTSSVFETSLKVMDCDLSGHGGGGGGGGVQLVQYAYYLYWCVW